MKRRGTAIVGAARVLSRDEREGAPRRCVTREPVRSLSSSCAMTRRIVEPSSLQKSGSGDEESTIVALSTVVKERFR